MRFSLPRSRGLVPGSRKTTPRLTVCPAAGWSPFDSLKKLGKQVQGSLPIVGLVSRWTSPEGGFGEQSYPEYTRRWSDAGDQQLNFATVDMEAKYGRVGSRRTLFLILWMIQKGLGLLKPVYFVLAARRLRASMDVEAEMIRFESYIEEESAKYDYLERPSSTPREQLIVAVDAIATCCFGLKDGTEIQPEDQGFLVDILTIVYPETTEADVRDVLSTRKDRKYANTYQ